MEYWKFLGMPPDWSANGAEIDSLIFWVHMLMLVLFVGWAIYFVYALVRFRAARSATADYRGVRNHLSSYVEVGVAVVEVLLLVGISIPVWADRIEYPVDADEEPLRVRVLAQQFVWSFHYPGYDGKFGRTDKSLVFEGIDEFGLDRSDPAAADDLVTLNNLYLPVDTPVELEMTSKDVIHSFFIPVTRVKTDVIPGQTSSLWFRPTVENPEEKDENGNTVFDATGKPKRQEAHIACAQLCGIQHSVMRGWMWVRSKGEHDAWYLAQLKAANPDFEPPK